MLSKTQIERLAEADEHELVREVQVRPLTPTNTADAAQEFYADYSPLTSSHFSLSILPTPLHPLPNQRAMALYGDSPNKFSPASTALARHVEGLTAVLLSLKKRPIVRYERMSGMARKLAQEVTANISSNPELWDFRTGATQPILIILDRRNDPVTPLLTQWTYQAMVHELIGITNGRVDLSEAQDVRDDMKVRQFRTRIEADAATLQEIVLSPDQDPFFATNLYDNFGDLGAHLSAYVSDYSSRSASSNASKIETVADMKRSVLRRCCTRLTGTQIHRGVSRVSQTGRERLEARRSGRRAVSTRGRKAPPRSV